MLLLHWCLSVKKVVRVRLHAADSDQQWIVHLIWRWLGGGSQACNPQTQAKGNVGSAQKIQGEQSRSLSTTGNRWNLARPELRLFSILKSLTVSECQFRLLSWGIILSQHLTINQGILWDWESCLVPGKSPTMKYSIHSYHCLLKGCSFGIWYSIHHTWYLKNARRPPDSWFLILDFWFQNEHPFSNPW